MIRGEFLDISKEDLNTIRVTNDMIEFMKKLDRPIGDRSYYKIVTLDEYHHRYGELECSSNFREQCLFKGFELLNLYPCYHQGWELDQWGAIGKKDGKKYVLETDHGSLQPVELQENWKPFFKMVKSFFVKEDKE